MKLSPCFSLIIQWIFIHKGFCEDPAVINPDGSFQFGYNNNDQGAHFHHAKGNPVIKVRGKYGSRNPINGRIDETVYTAGPRGFRARGPNVHRKQSLSQAPVGPMGSPNDPLADPYDDPSYSFDFKTRQHSRREEADNSGRVTGEYVYVDDIGEKHGVKYRAGANSGFEVENGVPDSPSSIRYNSPLYKAPPTSRGKITFERGPDRQYKFLTSSPDQRRSEATGPDGITRGSYSYLDDEGVQRTVQYIAGAGIGYKVIQSTVGPGTHVSANSAVPEHSIKSVSNEISVGDHTGPGSSSPSYLHAGEFSPTPYPPSAFSTDFPHPSSPRPFSRPGSTPSSGYPRGPSPFSPSAPTGPSGSGEADLVFGLLPPRVETLWSPHPTSSGPADVHITPSAYYPTPTPTYLPTSNGENSPPHQHPNQHEYPESPNTYDGWFYSQRDSKKSGLRAHIQNIDLVPLHDRALSPSEALRLDEERDAQHHRNSQLRV